jgi:molecular chaperone GrpE (heat shock protein)
MSASSGSKFTPLLRQMMQRVGFSSFKGLQKAAGVSKTAIVQLRQGKVTQLKVGALMQLSQALQVSVEELLTVYKDEKSKPSILQTAQLEMTKAQELDSLRNEYARLQQRLNQQQEELKQQFQQESLQILESLLIQLPTAAYAAQQNPEAPAVKLLPLLRPLDRLLEAWGIAAIAPVGAEVPFDPQYHQLTTGTAEIGQLVQVRYTGYYQRDKLLYRAKVTPILC